MKVKLFDVNRAHPILKKLLTMELPIKIAFKLSRFAKAFNDVYESLEERRVALVEKYGEALPDGGHKVEGESVVPFQAEFGELLQLEADVACEPLNLDELGDVKLTVLEVLGLEPFLTEGK